MKKIAYFSVVALSILLITTKSYSQTSKVKIGAYYFDGWSANSKISTNLTANFSSRKSKWGWITSTPAIMKEQIDSAANAGLSFFSFCWYYRNAQVYKSDPLNTSLNLFLNAPNNSRLGFNLMVANHAGFEIKSADWDNLTDIWIQLFKSPQYEKVDGKPYILFFSLPTLINSFGSVQGVNNALDKFRQKAKAAGLNGVTIGICIPPNVGLISQATKCGFDIFSGYNYHEIGFKPNPLLATSFFKTRAIPVSNILHTDTLAWSTIVKLTRIPYIPVTTLNWDPRPWADSTNHYNTAPYFSGYGSKSVYQSVRSLIDWINAHPDKIPKEKIGMLYAWNEYGEGAWLTPTKKINPLIGLRKAVFNR